MTKAEKKLNELEKVAKAKLDSQNDVTHLTPVERNELLKTLIDKTIVSHFDVVITALATASTRLAGMTDTELWAEYTIQPSDLKKFELNEIIKRLSNEAN